MPSSKENYQPTKENNVNLDKFAASSGLGLAAIPLTIVASTAALEIVNGDPSITKMALAGILTIGSVQIEKTAFETNGFSGAPLTTVIHRFIRRAKTAAIIGHGVTVGVLSGPFVAAAIHNNDPKALAIGATAAAFTTAGINTPINTLILRDKMDPMVKGIKKRREAIGSGVKRRITRKDRQSIIDIQPELAYVPLSLEGDLIEGTPLSLDPIETNID